MKTAVLREKKQITLPGEVMTASGWKVGDVIAFDFEGGELRGRKLTPPEPEEVGLDDVDPKTLLPRGWKIDRDKIREAVKIGRERE